MCGRYALHSHPDVIALQFGLDAGAIARSAGTAPRYNIAPTSQVLAVRASQDGVREPALLRWGLVPRWAKDPKTGARMNNARAETVAQKPSFREAFRRRRCLLPANGFYEWQGEKGRKQPWYVSPADGELFAFAALWERWEGEAGPLETCAIVTTGANETMAPIHDRMPVIVAPRDFARWLDADARARVDDLLRPCPAGAIRAWPVGSAVNRAANDLPSLTEPVRPA